MAAVEAPGRLVAAAAALLDACAAALATIDETPRAFLYPGQPPVELGDGCESMVAVYVGVVTRLPTTLTGGALGAVSGQTIARVPMVDLTVMYARCVQVWSDNPNLLPDPAALTQEAVLHMQSGWALANGIHNAARRGLFAECRSYGLGALTPLLVSGQTAGWTGVVSVELDGYDPFV